MNTEQKTQILNSMIEEFVSFKNYALGLGLSSGQFQSAIHHLDTGFLWLREAIFAVEEVTSGVDKVADEIAGVLDSSSALVEATVQ